MEKFTSKIRSYQNYYLFSINSIWSFGKREVDVLGLTTIKSSYSGLLGETMNDDPSGATKTAPTSGTNESPFSSSKVKPINLLLIGLRVMISSHMKILYSTFN